MHGCRKHSSAMTEQGLGNSSARLFSNPAGDYGSMVNERVGSSEWEDGSELGDTWASRNAFSYGRQACYNPGLYNSSAAISTPSCLCKVWQGRVWCAICLFCPALLCPASMWPSQGLTWWGCAGGQRGVQPGLRCWRPCSAPQTAWFRRSIVSSMALLTSRNIMPTQVQSPVCSKSSWLPLLPPCHICLQLCFAVSTHAAFCCLSTSSVYNSCLPTPLCV